MMSLASIIDPLRAANRLSRRSLFEWKIISPNGQAIELTCGIKIPSEGDLAEVSNCDVFVLLAGFHHESQLPKSYMAQLNRAARKANTVFAVEAGTWLLARAGLVSTQRVTTHWEDLELFSQRYPSLKVVGDRFVVDGNIWTSGGAAPTVDMMLHFIRTIHHPSLAMDVASVFVYNSEPTGETQQSELDLNKLAMQSQSLSNAVRIMTKTIDSPRNIVSIAREIQISVRTLESLFKTHLSASPSAYYLRLRLQVARRLILGSNFPMTEISLRVGFSNAGSFSRAFRQRYAISPLSLRLRSLSDTKTIF